MDTSPASYLNTHATGTEQVLRSNDTGSSPRLQRSAQRQPIPVETSPLLETTGSSKPPMAESEIDEYDNRETVNKPYPGVDDGFFTDSNNGVNSGRTPNTTGTAKPFPRYFPDSEIGGLNPDLESIPDVNVYQHKKTLAQGMMDLALFSANANQLRYVLESSMHPYYYSGICLISISLVLQVFVGLGLLWNTRYNVKDKKQICKANKINNFTVIGIFLVTVVNVFISSFGTTNTVVVSENGQILKPFPVAIRARNNSEIEP